MITFAEYIRGAAREDNLRGEQSVFPHQPTFLFLSPSLERRLVAILANHPESLRKMFACSDVYQLSATRVTTRS